MEREAIEITGKLKENRKSNILGFTKLDIAEIVNEMNQVLANYSVHYQKLRNFHWNVTGGDFFEIHERFEEQYNEAKVAVDDLAERIRVFNQTPLSTMKEYLDNSQIKESVTTLTATEMVREIIKDYRVLLDSLLSLTELAMEKGDIGTEVLAKNLMQSIEKKYWMMSAFSK